MAAVSFNFFHTQPYRSLRINDGRDMLTVALLAAVGVVVSEIGERRRRASDASKAHTRSEDALELVAAHLAGGSGPEVVWADVEAALVRTLDLHACQFVPAGSGTGADEGEVSGLAVLPRSGSLFAKQMHWGDGGFVLPPAGAALSVSYAGRNFGHIVVVPRAQSGSSIDARRMAIGLADQFAVALALSASAADEHRHDPATSS
jgi:K+-sensing histidine kinase KdpD